ncbi:MAG: 50S ribosomal protein L20 [Candidatus Komeilibacteria bacterium CG10_big_fil_rev_8_21_14_0_10_41_13]|uniref:Large ribosomal subunit protein bL20 n=1 Tax=Candidatus Komeilibacteria bacterium CG10_big_fil_rev_8_21_14_0_10_41_13 TaxID=1974476 RepID=A0A2M6WD42_9BACT|nr:MAG: 50S ribosomal protein L20 [Candidatus Komeilibacteria bacterium CG10_big_fil_rev_8_21_14_0_10_41_13]
MPRVKRGKVRARKRKAVLKQAKGYKWGRKKKIRLAKPAIKKAGVYAYRDRRVKKRVNRRLWQTKLNAAVRVYDLSYSKFINLLKKKKIDLDRKILAEIAEKNPEIFKKIVDQIK